MQPGYRPNNQYQYQYPASVDWEKFNRITELETKKLPLRDRRYFESAIKFIIGAKARLSRIKEKHLGFFTYQQDYVFTLESYPLLVNRDYVNKEIGKFVGKLDLMISIDGVGYLYGPLSHSKQDVHQNLVTHNETDDKPLPLGRRIS